MVVPPARTRSRQTGGEPRHINESRWHIEDPLAIWPHGQSRVERQKDRQKDRQKETESASVDASLNIATSSSERAAVSGVSHRTLGVELKYQQAEPRKQCHVPHVGDPAGASERALSGLGKLVSGRLRANCWKTSRGHVAEQGCATVEAMKSRSGLTKESEGAEGETSSSRDDWFLSRRFLPSRGRGGSQFLSRRFFPSRGRKGKKRFPSRRFFHRGADQCFPLLRPIANSGCYSWDGTRADMIGC